MKKICFFLFLAFSTGFAIAQNDVKQQLVAGNRVSINLPSSFGELKQRPQMDNGWYLDDTEKDVYLTLQYNADTTELVADNDIPALIDKELKGLKNLKQATYIDDGIFLQDGKNIGYIKFSDKPGIARYNMLFYMSIDNRLLQFLFSCPVGLRKKWEPLADAMANSLRFIN